MGLDSTFLKGFSKPKFFHRSDKDSSDRSKLGCKKIISYCHFLYHSFISGSGGS